MQKKTIIIGQEKAVQQAAQYLMLKGNMNLILMSDQAAQEQGIDVRYNTEEAVAVSAIEVIKQNGHRKVSRAERRALKKKVKNHKW